MQAQVMVTRLVIPARQPARATSPKRTVAMPSMRKRLTLVAVPASCSFFPSEQKWRRSRPSCKRERFPYPEGRVLQGEMTAQGAHLPSVQTRACGLHGAASLPRENTPLDVSLVAYSTSYGAEATHISAETQAFFTQEAARLPGCLLPTYAPDSTLMETRGTKSKPQDPHRLYGPTCEARTEKGEQALFTFAKALEEVRAL